MPAKLIDGKVLADQIRARLAKDIEAIQAKTGSPPKLASILVGANPGAVVYTRSQAKSCEEAGIAYDLVEMPADTTGAALAAKIDALGADPAVNGILLQMPLPEGVNARDMAERIPAAKDVEGITAGNLGRLLFYEGAELIPCTAAAAYELIKFAGCEIKGAECVVVGHSPIVGKPVVCLIVNDLGTCTCCHIGTRDLKAHTMKAEILVVAAGKAGLVRGEHIKPGATVIDVGINRVPVLDDKGQPVLNEKGKKKMKTVGDVDFDSAVQVAGAITPVPGGVGPVTVAMLLRNTVRAAMAQAG
ncbi:MAG TPA: bifunctional 5,10-methylenetetrahydrofolate dehydrogenase/5,10-methenyltetrahydrofolate cyclohydrolase [Phycisphaerae bacterium]|nr:bifunctional 5,10-methylenetetrahydrofolate dehydrogenase/5,10-methenyltetrahydrofolate cyclohydrolase [Phycisphaerae bacterium]